MKMRELTSGSVLAVIFILITQCFAQAPDTLWLDPLTGITAQIAGDTTATGERNNPNRVYGLKRNNIYFWDGILQVDQYHLQLVGEYAGVPVVQENDPNSVPPVLFQTSDSEGNARGAVTPLDSSAVTMKNLITTAVNELNNWYHFITKGAAGNDCRYVFDNCVFVGANSNLVVSNAGSKHYFTDCYFQNTHRPAQFALGRIINTRGGADSSVIENCTLVNIGTLQNKLWRVNYFRANHNTLMNVGQLFQSSANNQIYTNNINYNVEYPGVTKGALEGRPDWMTWTPSIFEIDTSFTEIDSIEFNQLSGWNSWFLEDGIKDHYAQTLADFAGTEDSLRITYEEPLIDDFTKSLYESRDFMHWQVQYMDTDPQFTTVLYNLDSLVQYTSDMRNPDVAVPADHTAGSTPIVDFSTGQGYPIINWPIANDLTYANNALMTAGSDGLPLGDLNWYPDKKADWEANKDQYIAALHDIIDNPTAVATNKAVADQFVLAQNYPNPFNPTTNIAFSLEKPLEVDLTVYNMLGQKVKQLISKKMTAGSHAVKWDGTNTVGHKVVSGVYFYKLETELQSETKKMMLIK